MPTNVTPDYKRAELAFRRAREPRERLDCLKEMLRTIPKHKGTEHVQADIKSRIKELTDELAGPRKGAARGGTPHTLRHEGAAQVALIGPPNAGKSSLHARLTASKSEVGPYPFTTKLPVPGMLTFEDIHFQLVDLPPIAADYMEPWLPVTLQGAEAALLVVDLSDPACTDQVEAIVGQLARRKIILSERWPGFDAGGAPRNGGEPGDVGDLPDPFKLYLPTLLIGNKSDLDPAPDEVQVFEELLGIHFPALATSAQTGHGLGQLGPLLFRGLAIVRVYTKTPGKQADKDRPFTVRRGDTVLDVARLVHEDLAASLKFARVWGASGFPGQQVGPEHVVADGDVVELHV